MKKGNPEVGSSHNQFRLKPYKKRGTTQNEDLRWQKQERKWCWGNKGHQSWAVLFRHLGGCCPEYQRGNDTSNWNFCHSELWKKLLLEQCTKFMVFCFRICGKPQHLMMAQPVTRFWERRVQPEPCLGGFVRRLSPTFTKTGVTTIISPRLIISLLLQGQIKFCSDGNFLQVRRECL